MRCAGGDELSSAHFSKGGGECVLLMPYPNGQDELSLGSF